MPRNSEFGAVSLTTTVWASGVSIEARLSIMKDGLPFTAFRRSNDHLTSFASTGEPSENLAAGSSLKVNCVASAFTSQEVAMFGPIDLLSTPSATSVS